KLGLGGACAALRDVLRAPKASAQPPPSIDPPERHLRGLPQLTFGGQNAQTHLHPGGTPPGFSSARPPLARRPIFTMRDDGSEARLVSTGRGRTTCAFFTPDGRRLIYASTHLGGDACPPPPDRSSGYVWPIYPTYDIFTADADGGHLVRLTDNDGYDAEGAIGPDGRIVFTSLRQGDLDLYVMDADGRNVRRLTDERGYDGGPFFSWDGKMIVFRAHRPKTRDDLEEYRALLARSLVRPRVLELYVMRSDGTGLRQVTRNGAANFAPFLHPNGQQIVF